MIWEVVWVSVRMIVGSLGLGAEDGRFSGFGGFVLGKKWGGWVWGNKVEGGVDRVGWENFVMEWGVKR